MAEPIESEPAGGSDPITGGSPPISCAMCGRAAPRTRGAASGVPLTWVSSLERGRLEHTCAECSRANLRSIEGRLDRAWW